MAGALLWALALAASSGRCLAFRTRAGGDGARSASEEVTNDTSGEAYALMIYGNQSHTVGLMTVVYNIRKFDKQRDIVVLTPVSNKEMERDLAVLNARVLVRPWINSSACGSTGRLAASFFKLHVWNLTQYRTVVYLESDMLIRVPLDVLFHRAGYMIGKDAIMIAPQGNFRCPDGDWTRTSRPNMWNTGLMAIRPSRSFADAYREMVAGPKFGKDERECKGGSQHLENVLFRTKMQPWEGESTLTCIPPRYNCKNKGCVADPAVVHWTGDGKPWSGAVDYDHFLPDWEAMRRSANAKCVPKAEIKAEIKSEIESDIKNIRQPLKASRKRRGKAAVDALLPA